MKTLLYDTLLSLGYPVYLHGTIAEDEAFPESFITFLTTYSANLTHYDNMPRSCEWRYQVIFYSKNPLLVASVPDTLRAKLKAAGFIPQGKGYDIPSDEPTHTGWVQEYRYIEMEDET